MAKQIGCNHVVKNLPNKQRCKFLTFDVVDFYPSISEKLLNNAINYAKQFTVVYDHTIHIILHCRKSLLFSSDGTWIQKDCSLFDVTMGSFDGAEICQIVGLFMLHNLANVVGAHNIGLYRDEGCIWAHSGAYQEENNHNF